MKIAESIYETLQSNYGYHQDVSIEDIVHNSCGYHHYLRLKGTQPSHIDSGKEIFLKQYAKGLKSMVRGFLKKCFKDRFQHEPVRMLNNAVSIEVDGRLDGFLVDVVPISTKHFSKGVPKSIRLIEATKAGLLGEDTIIVILIDRNSLKWSGWTISGEFSRPAQLFASDVDYVTGLLEGTVTAIGISSPHQCSKCPFEQECDVQRSAPEALPVMKYMTTEDKKLIADLDAYLWDLNKAKNTRMTHCIHPSEFSIYNCDRRIGYGLLGTKKQECIDSGLRRIFDAGHAVHEVVQLSLLEAYDDFYDEVLAVHEDLKIKGHCDGVMGDIGFEIKSIGEKGYKSLRSAKSDHRKQATLYAGCLELKSILYVYVCKETGDIAVYHVPVDRKVWHKQAIRADRIIKAVERDDLPPPIENKDYLCRKCPYAWECKPHMTKSNFR